MALSFSRLLDPARINLEVKHQRRTAAIHDVARLLEDHPSVMNFQGFYAELLARERVETTSIGNGVAIPHARTDHVSALVVAVGRSSSGIAFKNGEGLVHLIFVIGTPKTASGTYLAAVGSLCRIAKNPATRKAMMEAADPAGFLAAISAAENP